MTVIVEDVRKQVNVTDSGVVVTIDDTAGITVRYAAEQGPPGPSGALIPTSEVTSASVNLVVNQNYILNKATLVTATLPSVASVGSRIQLIGKGIGGWKLAQSAGQVVRFLSMNTTLGIGGSLSSTNRYDCITLICLTANNEWVVTDSMGNIEVI